MTPEHDTANPPAEPVVCTVATPRSHFSREIYTGAELQRGTSRAGAYDALRLPSLFNGRRSAPGTVPEPSTVWTRTVSSRAVISNPPVAKAPAAPVERRTGTPRRDRAQTVLRPLTPPRPAKAAYVPREGSIPSRLLAHLTEFGGHVTYTEVAQRFDMPRSSTTAIFKKALAARLFIRVLVDKRAAFALPGYEPPPPAATPPKQLASLQARLARRLAEVAALEREVRELEARTHRPSTTP